MLDWLRARSRFASPAIAKATTSGGDMMKLSSTSGCTRPGKLRLPDRIATGSLTPSAWALTTTGVSGPGLPMQVVQPNPTMSKPTEARSSMSPARLR